MLTGCALVIGSKAAAAAAGQKPGGLLWLLGAGAGEEFTLRDVLGLGLAFVGALALAIFMLLVKVRRADKAAGRSLYVTGAPNLLNLNSACVTPLSAALARRGQRASAAVGLLQHGHRGVLPAHVAAGGRQAAGDGRAGPQGARHGGGAGGGDQLGQQHGAAGEGSRLCACVHAEHGIIN